MTNDKRCVLPWIHLATTAHGQSRLCCISGQSYHLNGDKNVPTPLKYGDSKIADIFESEYMDSIRMQMVANQVPPECRVCARNEELTGKSKRLAENQQWGAEVFTQPKLRYMDIRFGSGCNLTCVMCSSRDSSAWDSFAPRLVEAIDNPTLKKYLTQMNHIEIPNKQSLWHKKDSKFWNDLLLHIPTLEQIYFAGGEPLIQKEHLSLLHEIVKQGHSKKIALRYNTNATVIPEDLIPLWVHFKNVNLTISLDGHAEKNNYIRYGSNWDSLIANIKKVANLDFINLSCTFTVQNFNVFYIPEFFESMEDMSVFKKGDIDLNILHTPRFLNIQNLRAPLKEAIQAKILNWKKHPEYSQHCDKVLKHMMAPCPTDRADEFLDYYKALDIIRGTDFSQAFPEWSKLIHAI